MSQEPARLLDSPNLPQAERELLDAGRALPPVHYDVSAGALRFRAALEAAANVGAGAGTAAVSGMSAGVKLALVGVAALFAGLGYFALREPAPRAPSVTAPVVRPLSTTTAPQVTQSAARPASARPSEPMPAPQVQLTPEPPEKLVRSRRVVAVHSHASDVALRGRATQELASRPSAELSARPLAPAATAAPTPAAPAETQQAPNAEPTARPQPSAAKPAVPAESIDELRAIARARMLLTSDPEAALTLLERVAREHPKGYFVEERAALTVLALAALGKDDLAEQRGRAFLRAYPHSPHAERVRAALQR